MLIESKSKVSRGWKYKELNFDLSEKQENDKANNKTDNKPLKGVQISIFD